MSTVLPRPQSTRKYVKGTAAYGAFVGIVQAYHWKHTDWQKKYITHVRQRIFCSYGKVSIASVEIFFHSWKRVRLISNRMRARLKDGHSVESCCPASARDGLIKKFKHLYQERKYNNGKVKAHMRRVATIGKKTIIKSAYIKWAHIKTYI